MQKKNLFNQTAYGVLRDIVHSYHRGFLYFQAVIQFVVRINVILSTAIRKVQPSLENFYETPMGWTALRAHVLYRISAKSDNK
jgi:hypothetical protein